MMEDNEKLTGADYAIKPLVQLASHPDYNRHASRIVVKILDLTSDELTQLDLAVLEIHSKRKK